MRKNEWYKNRLLLPILGVGISFLIGLYIPINIFPWNSEVSLDNSSSNSSDLDIESSGIAEKPNNPTPVIYEPEELDKLGSIPQEYQGKILSNIVPPSDRKVIALTFDDGPSEERTNDILYVLKNNNVKATFFVIGRNVQAFPELTLKIVQHGHAIGNHTWSHPYAQQSKASAARQIDRTSDVIYQITGVETKLFRPPGGYMNNGLVSHARSQKDAIIMWSSDSSDYKSSTKQILKNSLSHASNGGIILLHDGGGDRWNTLVALPHLIDELRKQGYEFVTIPELLEMEIQNNQQLTMDN